MHGASPQTAGPPHEVPAAATLRNSCPVIVPIQQLPPAAPLPSRPTLLPLSFVLLLVAAVGFGSSAVSLTVGYFYFGRPPALAQVPVSNPFESKAAAAEPPRPAPQKEKPAPPAANTLAVLPFEYDFEPTPAFLHEAEKLNASLPQSLIDEGKLRVLPMAKTAPLRYCRNPIEAARDLKVRAVLTVRFTTEAGKNMSTCSLELIDATTGFLLLGLEFEAPHGFLSHPEILAEIRQSIVEQVPKRMAPPR